MDLNGLPEGSSSEADTWGAQPCLLMVQKRQSGSFSLESLRLVICRVSPKIKTSLYSLYLTSLLQLILSFLLEESTKAINVSLYFTSLFKSSLLQFWHF